jgi:hypothetical protein
VKNILRRKKDGGKGGGIDRVMDRGKNREMNGEISRRKNGEMHRGQRAEQISVWRDR